LPLFVFAPAGDLPDDLKTRPIPNTSAAHTMKR
jgi:hypothetical protein